MSTSRRRLRNTGEWAPVVEWLDELAGGKFIVPMFHRPPITRKDDGTLILENRDGYDICAVGEYVVVDPRTGEFHKKTHADIQKERAHEKKRLFLLKKARKKARR